MEISLPVLIALVLVAAVLAFCAARYLSQHTTPAAIQQVEADVWTELGTLIAKAADSSSDQATIAAANARIATRAQNVANLKTKVNALS